MDAHTKASFLGFGLVMLTQVIALLVLHIRSGGGMPGYLERSTEVKVPKSKLGQFQEKFRHRLVELGFQPGANGSEFLQQEPPLENFGVFPHSKTPKKLTLRVEEADEDMMSAKFHLRYENFILVDTGESIYAAELLNFLSGRTETMRSVPNQSLTAWNSLVGGLLACGVSAYMISNHTRSLWPGIVILGVTEFAVGLAALAGMWLRRGEVVGRGKAIAGIILCGAAVVGSLAWILNAKVDAVY